MDHSLEPDLTGRRLRGSAFKQGETQRILPTDIPTRLSSRRMVDPKIARDPPDVSCTPIWKKRMTANQAAPALQKAANISAKLKPGVSIIVPAFNEADSVADTIRSLRRQTVEPARIIVVDDGSTDSTGQIARALGVDVFTPPMNTGSKAGAQNFALLDVDTEFVMAVDADTVLAPDAVEHVLHAISHDPLLAAACGYVIPQEVNTLWERGRYVEYLYSFAFAKRIQDFYRSPLISSGCFSIYRTALLKGEGGWSTRTLAEDMDLTWSFYAKGYGVRFVPEALCYPVEPTNVRLMRIQLRRWSHGFWQNVRLHARGLPAKKMLASTIAVVVWDAVIASLIYLVALPLLSILVSPVFLLGYVIDVPLIAVPVLADARRRGETLKALVSIPCFVVLRLLNVVMMIQAFILEMVLQKSYTTYVKGH